MTHPPSVDLPPFPRLEVKALKHLAGPFNEVFTRDEAEDFAVVYARAFAKIVFNDALERAAVAVMAEKVDAEETGEDADYAYNRALDHAQAAIRALKGKT